MTRRAPTLGAVLGAALAAHATGAHAAAPQVRGAAVPCTVPAAGRAWPAPLDRPVSLQLRDVALRTALDRLAAAARLRLSYSGDLLPLDRAVCLTAASAAAGDVLVALLAGTGTTPVALGAEQVVLAPGPAAGDVGEGPAAAAAMARAASPLDRVVVTGTAAASGSRGSPFAVRVVDGAALGAAGGRSLAQGLAATVPGLWIWTQAPSSLLARWGSVRGASSFGASAPKLYIDGIEVANPLVVTQLDPERLQRVEVIRGPQGAALHGADAIGGVVNIVTRHDGADGRTPAVAVRAGAGALRSDFAAGGVLVQDHALSLRAGSGTRSAALGLTVGTVGAYVPGADARQLLGTGSARLVGARHVLTATARLAAHDADATANPLLAGVLPGMTPGYAGAPAYRATRLPAPAGPQAHGDSTRWRARADTLGWTTRLPGDARQSVRQYTLGGTATFQPDARWTHALVAGIDGYRLAGVATEAAPLVSSTDSALLAARGDAQRLTLRASSTLRADTATAGDGTSLTLAAEHSTARERTAGTLGFEGAGTPVAAWRTAWWGNTGLVAQARTALADDAVHLTGGARVEHLSGPGIVQIALLPMLGAAYVRTHGAATVKLRTAYGRGIRPARTVARGATLLGGRFAGTATGATTGATTGPVVPLVAQPLAPEAQAGTEAGLDLLVGRRLGLHLTRFDQRATGLIQPVAVLGRVARGEGGPGPAQPAVAHVAYELQNVGAITNRGWELEATAAAGALSLAGTLSLVDSRVAQVADRYTGELRAGDRMLEVPARTMSLTAAWARPRWSASWTVSRAADWINYDRLALAGALASATTEAPTLVGAPLRAYWRRYDGVTRLRATASWRAWRSTSVLLTGDNLLDVQRGEPDNATVLPGRAVTLGVRTGF